MQSVLAAFPRRPLTLKPGRSATGGWVLAILGLLLFGGFLVLVGAQIAPEIRDDLAIRDTARPAPQVRVNGGRCRSRLFMFQDCEVTLTWRGKDGTGTRTMSYMFVEPHMGSWNVMPMMDPARPDLVSTDLGIERLTNRIVTAIGAVIVALALIAGGFVAARKAQRISGEVKALSGRVLEPVPVAFDGWGQQTWKIRDEHGTAFEWPVGKKDKPFVLDEQRGLMLALRPAEGGPAFPLDEKLRFVTLSPEERAAIRQAGGLPPT
ncbi:hypothetical protein GXW78_07270 [Roseomonas terrae]|uniref:DUF3592 domain-containing protein n=1 Tax=Neoroseomonas terrae TaxID=424799 RepID=A0ABS5EEK4_9PROT|nr:hypothetical protein [Neoroseomonas terrae]MBR0649455.1 hypothetical protein [Neoroseomonas terrae]